MKFPFRKLPRRHTYKLMSNCICAFPPVVPQMFLALLDCTASSLKKNNNLRVYLCIMLLFKRLPTPELIFSLLGELPWELEGFVLTSCSPLKRAHQKCSVNCLFLQDDENVLLRTRRWDREWKVRTGITE